MVAAFTAALHNLGPVLCWNFLKNVNYFGEIIFLLKIFARENNIGFRGIIAVRIQFCSNRISSATTVYVFLFFELKFKFLGKVGIPQKVKVKIKIVRSYHILSKLDSRYPNIKTNQNSNVKHLNTN